MQSFAGANFGHSNQQTGGQGMGSGDVGQMTRTVRGVATDMGTTFDEMLGTLQTVTDMGMMDTVRNAKDFERKFKTITESLKTVSKTLGSSLQDAAGFVGSMRRSGVYEAGVGQATLQRRTFASEGFKGTDFSNAQRFGAAVSHGSGGLRGSGARLATRMVTDMSRANRLGVYSDEDLLEATGMEGREGHLAMAQVATQTAFQFTKSPMGKAMMMYAGEIKDGKYTGRVDSARMAAASSGSVSARDIASQGRDRLGSSRATKASFVANQGRLGGAMAEKAGPEVIGTMVRSLVGDRFGDIGEDDITSILMERFTGLDRSQAEILAKMSKEMGTISRQRRRDERAEIDRVIQSTERDMHTSWEATKSKMSQGWNSSIRDPLRQMGTDLGGAVSSIKKDIGASATEAWTGQERVRTAPTMSERRLQNIAYGLEDDTGPTGGRFDDHFGLALDTKDMSQTARENLMGAGQGAYQEHLNRMPKWARKFELPHQKLLRKMTSARVGVTTSVNQVRAEEDLERSRASGTWRADQVGLESFDGDLTQAASEVLGAMPRGFDYQDEGAVEKMRSRVLKHSVLQKSPELRRALAASAGVSEKDLLSGKLTRKQKAKVSDSLRYIMAEGAGAGALGGEGKYMTGALAADSAKQYDESKDELFGYRLLGNGSMRSGMSGAMSASLTSIIEGGEDGRDALMGLAAQVSKNDDSSIADLEEYTKALELAEQTTGGASKLLEQKKFDKFRSFNKDQAGAALQALRNVRNDGKMGGLGGMAKDIALFNKSSGGQLDGDAKALLQGRGAAMAAGLDGAGLSAGLSTAVSDYAASLGSGGAALGSNVGAAAAGKVSASLRLLGSKEEKKERAKIAGLTGGQQMLDQVDALRSQGDLEGLKTEDEVMDIVKELGLPDTPELRDRVKEMLESDGDIDSTEAGQLSEMFAKNIGSRGALSKGGGTGTGSIHGSSAQLAAQLQDTESLHAQYATTVANAIEKISKHTGIDPTPTSPKSVDPYTGWRPGWTFAGERPGEG